MAIDSKEMMKKYFKIDNGEVIFTGSKLIIQIP